MVCRSAVSSLAALLATGCFSEPPNTPAGGDATSTTTTGPASSGTTLEPPATGSGSSTGPSDTTGLETTGAPTGCAGAPHILRLAFDGVTLTNSLADNAPELLAFDPLIVGTHGAYTGDDQAQILNLVRGHFMPFDVCVTDQVPEALDYDLIVVTSDTLADGNAVGFASVDCGNTSPNNVNVVFLSDRVEIGTSKRAIAISKLAAGLYGLESLGPPALNDIMNAFLANTLNGATFSNVCLELAGTVCVAEACDQGQQNAAARLNAAFG